MTNINSRDCYHVLNHVRLPLCEGQAPHTMMRKGGCGAHETLTGLRSVLVQVLNRYFNSEEDIFKERIVFYTTGSTESSDNQNTVLVLVLVWGARLQVWKYGARINVG